MKLPERLMSIVKFIPCGESLVDVGTDHALLPIYLIKKGIADRVIAGDLKQGPLSAAARNVKEAGLETQINLRLGDGLEIIRPGEVGTAVIAGMGGSTIRTILENSIETALSLKRLVLQPLGAAGELRLWLVKNGWRIDGEDLVKEENRIYEIVSAVPGKEDYAEEAIVMAGPKLYRQKHPLLAEVLGLELDKHRKNLSDMQKSESEETNIKRKKTSEKIRQLEWVLQCLSNARQR